MDLVCTAVGVSQQSVRDAMVKFRANFEPMLRDRLRRGIEAGDLAPDTTAQPASADPMKPARRRADTTRAHLGTWVRGLGVDDPELSPNHAWRHTFKRIAAASGIPEKMHDAITGHTPASEGRRYGQPSVADMVAALKKFPRYKLD
jgi:integrase